MEYNSIISDNRKQGHSPGDTAKEPKKRLRQTIALAIAFLILYSGILLYIEQRQYNNIVMKDSVYKTELVRRRKYHRGTLRRQRHGGPCP